MKKTSSWIAGLIAIAALALTAKLALDRAAAIADVARAVWDDPDVRKIRRRSAKKIRKAAKRAVKAVER